MNNTSYVDCTHCGVKPGQPHREVFVKTHQDGCGGVEGYWEKCPVGIQQEKELENAPNHFPFLKGSF